MKKPPKPLESDFLFRKERLWAVALRYFLYTATIFAALALLPLASSAKGVDVFKEGGVIEWSQFVLITTGGLVLLFVAMRRPDARPLLPVLAMLCFVASVRENDSALDDFVPVFGWQGPMTILVAVLAVYVWKRRRAMARQSRRFVLTASFGILWSGFVVTALFAQLVGHGDFLKSLMGDHYSRNYKRVIEESCETFGYFLIFIGSLEAVRLAWRPKESEPENAPPSDQR